MNRVFSTRPPEVIAKHLGVHAGALRRVAEESGVPYDTILRLKNKEGDPRFGTLERTARYLGYRIVLERI